MSFVRGVVTAQCSVVLTGCGRGATVDSGSTSSRLPKQIARSHGHGLLADGLGQHGARQVHGGHMVGEDRGQREMTLGGLPASPLPSRLTESKVWSEDRIWLGLDS